MSEFNKELNNLVNKANEGMCGHITNILQGILSEQTEVQITLITKTEPDDTFEVQIENCYGIYHYLIPVKQVISLVCSSDFDKAGWTISTAIIDTYMNSILTTFFNPKVVHCEQLSK